MQYLEPPGALVNAARSVLLMARDRAIFDCSLQKQDLYI